MEQSFLLVVGVGGYVLTHNRVTTSGPLIKVRFANAGSLASAPVYVALEKGCFAQEGLDVSYLPFTAGKDALDAMLGGKADFATVADLPIAIKALEGSKFSVIAMLSVRPRLYGIIARRDQGISSAKDLRGKRIAVVQGTNVPFILDSFLLFHRIPRNDVQMVNVPPDGMADAMKKGDVQAAVIWEPVLSNIRDQLGTNAVIFYADEQQIYRMVWTVAATQDFIHKNPEIVKRMLQALLKAGAFIQQNRKEARQITARYISVTNEHFLDEYWMTYVPDVSLDPLLIQNLESETRWMIKNKLTDRKELPNYLDYIYFQGLESVKPEAVTIVH